MAGIEQLIALGGANATANAGQNVLGALQTGMQIRDGRARLSAMEDRRASAKRGQELAFGASVKVMMDKVRDPQQQQMVWAEALNEAKRQNIDTSKLPQTYDGRAKFILDYAYQQAGGAVKPTNVSRGGALVDPSTGRVIYQDERAGATQPDSRTSFLAGLGFKPGTPEYQEAAEKYYGPKARQQNEYFTPVQTGDGFYSFNARSGQLQPMVGPDGAPLMPAAIDPTAQAAVTGAKEGAKVTAKAGAQAALDLPQTIATSEYSIGLLDQMLKHPGLDAATGASSKGDPRNFVPGTDAYNFNVLLDQVQGRTFLQAFESLKGAGQITEIEGTKAQNAIARMNKAQSKEEFTKAVEEFKDIINAGLERARKRAALAPNQPAAPAQPAAPQAGPAPSAEDRAAIEWARANPNDPRAAQIMQLHGGQ